MSGSFGPWASAMGGATSPGLSQHWRSRIARLAGLRGEAAVAPLSGRR